jgi:hypothetical protein
MFLYRSGLPAKIRLNAANAAVVVEERVVRDAGILTDYLANARALRVNAARFMNTSTSVRLRSASGRSTHNSPGRTERRR